MDDVGEAERVVAVQVGQEDGGHPVDGESRRGDAAHHAGAGVEQERARAVGHGEGGAGALGVGQRRPAAEDDQARDAGGVAGRPREDALCRCAAGNERQQDDSGTGRTEPSGHHSGQPRFGTCIGML